MMKRGQCNWNRPETTKPKVELKLYNSLTRQKEIFTPIDGNKIKWYSCGPTVYDASHMGHARSYISFDILRRVLADYFGYNILYVMNITDIDDKIIKRARQNYLYEKYVGETRSLEELIADQRQVLNLLHETIKNNTDGDKKIMLDNTLKRVDAAVAALKMAIESKQETAITEKRSNFLSECRDPLSDWLDKRDGSTVSDNSIFEKLPRFWEGEFHKDMEALNVLPPDILTRVSEYVPEIVTFTEKIIENGFAYESNGSVYFDVQAFDAKDKHFYAKLVPEAYGDTKSLNDGEGDLSTAGTGDKRSPNDFALWKSSKAGEPWWESPWGRGRPGWHIECSAMASDICGQYLDIHTGGVDLKFPHHDNELAQSEAHFNNHDWVKYFLHTGHLTISGCKMSKSLKNFVTIQQALEKYSATQLRLAFLLHSWKDTLDYSDDTMAMATQYEKMLNEFFLNVKDLLRRRNTIETMFDRWTPVENEVQEKFDQIRENIDAALCDNIDTRTVLDEIRTLVATTNIYIRDHRETLNGLLLKRIAVYVTDLLYVFGTINGPRGGIGFPIGDGTSGSNLEESLMPYVSTMADFRRDVRRYARELKATDILKLCDNLRDEILPNLGVRLEDQEATGYSTVKLVDRNILLKELEAKKRLEAEKAAEKEKRKVQAEAAQALKDAQKKINPLDMFKSETDKYSAFDDKGLPTLDHEGKEISKGQIKKLQKLQQAQEKKYNDYLKEKENHP